MRTSERIQAEIQETIGFIPPFFQPAIQNPQVLENLWQQTLSAYILSPFSPLFKEKLSAYLSRYCTVSYCLVCHSCSLYPLGMNGREVINLLKSPPPSLAEIDRHLSILTQQKSELAEIAQLNPPVEDSLLRCAIFISLEQNLAKNCRDRLRQILGSENYQYLVAFIAYIRTCHAWMEAHPEVSYETDKRAIDYLATLLEEEPALVDFFQNYVEKVNEEQLDHFYGLSNQEEKQHVESQLIAENLRLVQAINSASVGIIITDAQQPDNPIIYSNPAFSQMTGYNSDEILGWNCRFLQGSSTEPNTIELLRNRISQAKEVKTTILNYRKDGQPFWNDLKISPVFSDTGSLLYFVGFQTDITEKKQLEVQVLRAQRLESVSNLASGMAHNLNNALTPVMMALPILEMNLKEEQNKKLLKTVTANIKRSSELVKQVLSFVQGVQGEHTVIKVEALIKEIEKLARNTFPRSIQVSTQISSSPLWGVRGDFHQLHQALVNLCLNACDAMPSGGTLSITAENFLIDANQTNINIDAQEGMYVAISVSDTGTGIAPEILNQIFDPFFTTKEFGTAAGIGLPTTQGIIKSHGGFINVYSEPGKGSKFNIYLPAVKIAETLSDDNRQDADKPLIGGELILLVDDENAILEITKATLSMYGYDVLTAGDGVEAIALYAKYHDRIRVVLMDMMMRSIDGMTALRAMHKINSKVPFIATSGVASTKDMASSTENYIQAFLSKPYSGKELLKVLQSVIGKETIDANP